MAKTISESVSSLESSNTSLKSTLSKCKSSIENKSVTVPSTTKFSGLPALIDQIDTTKLTFSVIDSSVVAELYARQSKVGEATGKTEYSFSGKPYNTVSTIKYGEKGLNSDDDKLEVYISDPMELFPHLYYVFADDISAISSIAMLDNNGAEIGRFNKMSMTDSDNVRVLHVFSTKGRQILINFARRINGRDSLTVPVIRYTTPSITILDVNTSNGTYNQLCTTYGLYLHGSDQGTF